MLIYFRITTPTVVVPLHLIYNVLSTINESEKKG